MKLASLRHGRDGKLVVVSDDLAWCAHEPSVPTLQAALDDWTHAEPRLKSLSEGVNNGTVLRERFHEREAASPLPRAYQWADGSAYVNHVALVRQARGAKMPESFWTDPLMYQGGSDVFLGPRDPIPLKDEAWGCDFEAEVAVVVDDCEAGVSPEEARKRIRLVMLVNDVSLRNLIPAELEKGFGFFQSKPASAFSPVAVTPDALGDAWKDGGPGKPVSEGGRGYSCIAEQRMIETIQSGKPATSFLKWGDRVEIEMRDAANHSIFGRIEQEVVKA